MMSAVTCPTSSVSHLLVFVCQQKLCKFLLRRRKSQRQISLANAISSFSFFVIRFGCLCGMAGNDMNVFSEGSLIWGKRKHRSTPKAAHLFRYLIIITFHPSSQEGGNWKSLHQQVIQFYNFKYSWLLNFFKHCRNNRQLYQDSWSASPSMITSRKDAPSCNCPIYHVCHRQFRLHSHLDLSQCPPHQDHLMANMREYKTTAYVASCFKRHVWCIKPYPLSYLCWPSFH